MEMKHRETTFKKLFPKADECVFRWHLEDGTNKQATFFLNINNSTILPDSTVTKIDSTEKKEKATPSMTVD
jgi:hypothetical protein